MQNLLIIIGLCFVLTSVTNLVYSDGVVSFNLAWSDHENAEISDNVCPNNRTKCTERQTCCATKHHSFHCCKYENAVCCPDKFHCCPHGSTCDIRRKKCNRDPDVDIIPQKLQPQSMEWPVVEETLKVEINEQKCPNNRTKCKDSQTCCETKHHSFHCCKYENAVCCPDKYHCCPEDSTCDMKRHRCVKSNTNMLALILPKVLLESKEEKPFLGTGSDLKIEDDDKTCPNNKTKCKDTKTCCITKHGNYYCCPHKNAVCCSDKYQCCPEGTTCDIKNKKCVSSSPSWDTEIHEWKMDESNNLIPAKENNFFEILVSGRKLEKQCQNSKLKCPGKKNCCEMNGGKFGCCTFDKGICCPDLKTCCPHETMCDVTKATCTAVTKDLIPL